MELADQARRFRQEEEAALRGESAEYPQERQEPTEISAGSFVLKTEMSTVTARRVWGIGDGTAPFPAWTALSCADHNISDLFRGPLPSDRRSSDNRHTCTVCLGVPPY